MHGNDTRNMKSKIMKKKILFAIIFLFVLFAISFLLFRQGLKSPAQIYETVCGKYQKGEVKIDSKILSVDIADTDCKLVLGLSGKKSLSEDAGMIFVFQKSGNYSFWMKDMNFPLDILWINDKFVVTGIGKNLATSTYPEIFGENYSTKYVLEISAGNSIKNNIKVGDKIIFSEK